MNLKSIFGTTLITVLVALAIWELFLRDLIAGFKKDGYDDTYNPDHFVGENSEKFLRDAKSGKIYKIVK